MVTLGLLVVAAVFFTLKRPNYVFFDSEREWGAEEKPVRSDLHFQAWLLGLLATIGVLGFMLGIFVYITTFMRIKAAVSWKWALAGAAGTVTVLGTFGYVLVLSYPRGLLQVVTNLPWPLD
jgi:hypothetical protein